ncbi:MAG: 5-formyltetrahydrofolate cyclo-ligase [Ignavibacteria bacterium]|nr:5-formyltetrahydrofolate cyclo-ligase [Ignavibacteria bacterium]
MTKSEIRSAVLNKRKAISPDIKVHLDMQIFERAHKHSSFQLCKSVHLYRSTALEVETSPFFEYAWSVGKDVYVPLADESRTVLKHVRVTRSTKWKKNSFGIQEPVPEAAAEQVDDEFFTSLTVVVVPLVAFDPHCNRIGYGKGYYDRFLKNVDAVSIGLAYECQKLQIISVDPHDVQLSCVATEERWYEAAL